MHMKLASTAAIGLLTLILSACGTMQNKSADAMPAQACPG